MLPSGRRGGSARAFVRLRMGIYKDELGGYCKKGGGCGAPTARMGGNRTKARRAGAGEGKVYTSGDHVQSLKQEGKGNECRLRLRARISAR